MTLTVTAANPGFKDKSFAGATSGHQLHQPGAGVDK